jgi:hypothetical protein
VILWFIATAAVVDLIGAVLDARSLEPLPRAAAVGFARADLVLVAGLSFVFSIHLGSFIGGASALAGLVVCAIVQRIWLAWPLRVLDTVGAPRWGQTSVWLVVAGAVFVAGGLLYLRDRG